MSGPRSLQALTAAAVVTLAIALVLAPVAGLPALAPAASERPAVAAPSGSLAGDQSTTDLRDPVRPDRNTTSYLALSGELQTREFGTAIFDVGGALAADSTRTHSIYETSWLRSSFSDAGNNQTERVRVVERGADRLETRIGTLEDRESRALARYNAGEISTRTYLRELAAIDRAAGSLRESVALLNTYSSAVDQPVSERRIASMKARLLPLEGPVRSRIAAAIRGDEPPVRVFVETSQQGLVLAAIDRGPFSQEYIREAHVPSARNPQGDDRFEAGGDRLASARDRAVELYPWAFENRGPTSTGSFGGEPFLYNAGVYSVRVGHPHGTSRTYDLVTFLDGGTTDVFREVQYKDLSAVPTVFAGANTTAGINLSVERTRTGGPMRVTVTNATSGEPVRTRILVNDEPVGTTDVTGERWTVAPGPTATVTAVHGGGNVTVTVFSDGAPTG